MSTTIYALCDPDSGEIRYIGKARRPSSRLSTHISEANQHQFYSARWIRSVGGRPTMRPLVVVPDNFGSEMEIMAIAHFRARGYRLTNSTGGGEGLLGHVHSQETRAKIRASHLGMTHTAETKARLSAIQRGRKGRPHSAESIGKMRAGKIGHEVSQETRAKIRAALLGRSLPEERVAKMRGRKITPEAKAKISAFQKGRVRSTETRARMSAARRAQPKRLLASGHRANIGVGLRRFHTLRRLKGER